MNINTKCKDDFEDRIRHLDKLKTNLENSEMDEIQKRIGELDEDLSINTEKRAQIGAKINRLDMTESKIEEEKIQSEELLSKNEDVDIAKTITDLKMQESVYRASLASGARIMQPTLVDFLQ